MADRKPHVLTATNNNKMPRRFVFFDSESETTVAITDEEVERAKVYQETHEGAPVRKEHSPYLICSTFYRKFQAKSKANQPERIKRQYYPKQMN